MRAHIRRLLAHARTHTITHTHTHQHTTNIGNLRVDVPQMINFEKAAKVSRGEKEDLIRRQAGA